MTDAPAPPPRPDAAPPAPRPGAASAASAAPWWRDARWRAAAVQAVTVICIAAAAWYIATNTGANLERAQRTIHWNVFDPDHFLHATQGIPVTQSLIDYAPGQSTYLDLFLLGLINTLLVAAVGIVLATLLGFVVGIARLSSNWLVATLAGAYVEVFRNIPLLVQILFWYNAVLKQLPAPRDGLNLFDAVFLNIRGLTVPGPGFTAWFWPVAAALAAGVAGTIILRRWARRRQAATGRSFPVFWAGLGAIVGLPLLIYLLLQAAGAAPLTFDMPTMGRFNLEGGLEIVPEFVALLVALTVYTAAFIAEAVRSGIQSVSRGQTEAAFALGLRPRPTLRLIIVPQAMRVIVPQLTNQYLNLTKNSSLGGAIGYSELVHVYMGAALTTSGHELEIVAMTMAVYLVISLGTSGLMNWYNRRIRLVER